MMEYMGIEVPDDGQGVLQDTHWASSLFGYFPTYSLGSAYAAQFYYAMKKELDFDACIAAGDIQSVTNWLHKHIQQYGRMYTPEEILIRSTGEKFNSEHYVRYLEDKFSKIYQL
jgi:carboxypeptidase Taq